MCCVHCTIRQDEFDADESGLIDDCEWDNLIAVLGVVSGATVSGVPPSTTSTPEDAPFDADAAAAALYDALNSSVAGDADGRSRTVGKIILARSNSELQTVKRLYGRKYHRTLVGQVNKELEGEYRNFVTNRLAPCDETRGAATELELAMRQAKEIAEADATRAEETEHLEQVLVEILGWASPSQICAIEAAYRIQTKRLDGGDTGDGADLELVRMVQRRLGHSELGWAITTVLVYSHAHKMPNAQEHDVSDISSATLQTYRKKSAQARLSEILATQQEEQKRLTQIITRLTIELTSTKAELSRSRSTVDAMKKEALKVPYAKDETVKFLREKVRTQAELVAVYHNRICVLKQKEEDQKNYRASADLRLREEEERTARLQKELSEERHARAATMTELSAEQAANRVVKAQLQQLTAQVTKHETDTTCREQMIETLAEEVERYRHKYEVQIAATQQANISNRQLLKQVAQKFSGERSPGQHAVAYSAGNTDLNTTADGAVSKSMDTTPWTSKDLDSASGQVAGLEPI